MEQAMKGRWNRDDTMERGEDVVTMKYTNMTQGIHF